jgi:hypothetical protein
MLQPNDHALNFFNRKIQLSKIRFQCSLLVVNMKCKNIILLWTADRLQTLLIWFVSVDFQNSLVGKCWSKVKFHFLFGWENWQNIDQINQINLIFILYRVKGKKHCSKSYTTYRFSWKSFTYPLHIFIPFLPEQIYVLNSPTTIAIFMIEWLSGVIFHPNCHMF